MGLGLNNLLENQDSVGPEPRERGASRGRGRSTVSVLRGLKHGEDLRSRCHGHRGTHGSWEQAANLSQRQSHRPGPGEGDKPSGCEVPLSGTPPVSEVTSPVHTGNLCSTGANRVNGQEINKEKAAARCSTADCGWKGLPISK